MHGYFPLGMLTGPSASLGFGLRILGLRVLSFSLALEVLAMYLFFSPPQTGSLQETYYSEEFALKEAEIPTPSPKVVNFIFYRRAL